MKYLFFICFSFFLLSINGQNIPVSGTKKMREDENTYEKLPKVDWTENLLHDQSIIYGNFFRRRGGGSGTTRHSIRLINVNTRELLSFVVKRKSQGKKNSIFICHIKPGTYQIINYKYSKDNGFIITTVVENIFKGIDITLPEIKKKIKAGEINLDSYSRYEFTIRPNTINDVGEWNLNNGIPVFSKNKKEIITIMKKYYRLISFDDVIVVNVD